MSHSWVRAFSAKKRSFRSSFPIISRSSHSLSFNFINHPILKFSRGAVFSLNFSSCSHPVESNEDSVERRVFGMKHWGLGSCLLPPFLVQAVRQFSSSDGDNYSELLSESDLGDVEDVAFVPPKTNVAKSDPSCEFRKSKFLPKDSSEFEYSKVEIDRLPKVVLVGRPNVGKSSLFNRLIDRREALVYNTPDDHVTRDIRDGVGKLGDLRFQVLDSAGLEMASISGSILHRTAALTSKVLAMAQAAVFLIDARNGLHPHDSSVATWLRANAPGLPTILAMNKAENIGRKTLGFAGAVGEAYELGYEDPIAISAETGLGMTELYESLRPVLDDYMCKHINGSDSSSGDSSESIDTDTEPHLQLAIVGRPNVGKSTMLNSLLQEERVLVGPEPGLTRDSVRVKFQFEGETIYLVDTAGWLKSAMDVRGLPCLGSMQARKSISRAHIVALVLDAKLMVGQRRCLSREETKIAQRVINEGRGLVVVVNKMDLLEESEQKRVLQIVPREIQGYIPEVSEIPAVFISALEGEGKDVMMREILRTYEKWCSRLSTGRLNRWLLKVMSRHSWKDAAAKPKIKYFTQVKARPPTFSAFTGSKVVLGDNELRFIKRSLVEDFDVGGIPLRIIQRAATKQLIPKKQKQSADPNKKQRPRPSTDKRHDESPRP